MPTGQCGWRFAQRCECLMTGWLHQKVKSGGGSLSLVTIDPSYFNYVGCQCERGLVERDGDCAEPLAEFKVESFKTFLREEERPTVRLRDGRAITWLLQPPQMLNETECKLRLQSGSSGCSVRGLDLRIDPKRSSVDGTKVGRQSGQASHVSLISLCMAI